VSKINVPFALLSLATSVFLWASVYNSQNSKPELKTFTVPLTMQKLDASRYVITQIPEEVSLTLRVLPDDLRKVTQKAMVAIIDLSDPKIGDNSCPVIVFPTTARDLLVNSAMTAHVKIDAIKTKRVEVSILRIGNLPSGFHEDSADTFPHWIYVTGPNETIQKVAFVQVAVNLSSVGKSPFEADLEPKPVDVNGRSLSKILMSEKEDHPEYTEENISNPLKVHLSVKFSPEMLPQNQNPPKL
jgi:YbbR domain-containing protein